MTKRILFCTIGATPQVVTETVWALQQRTPPWLPNEIHIVTTTFRLSVIRSSLMSVEGPLARLLGKLPRVVVQVPSRSGAPLVFDSLSERRKETEGSSAHQRLEDPGTLNDVNPHVRIDTNQNAIVAGGVKRILGPKLFAIYRLMATARKESWPGVGPNGIGSDCNGWLSVPFICIGAIPSRKRIDRVLLDYLRDAVQAAGGDSSDHESIREWEEGVVDETSPFKKLKHAQTALGARTRLLDTLRKEFGGPAAAVIGSKDTRTRQPRLLPGQPIRIEGSARFGLDLPPESIEID